MKKFSSMRISVITAIMLLTSQALFAQVGTITDSLFVVPDTLMPLSVNQLYSIMLKNHPTAKQAALLPELAKQQLRLAKGNFDPKLEADYRGKNYNEQEYYSAFSSSVKVPTRIGLTPVIGADRNTGKYLNPESTTDPAYQHWQFVTGIGIPLGRGLLTDERRAALKQAVLYGDLNEAEQVSTLNKLFLNVADAYWNWYHAYYSYVLTTKGVEVAGDIFKRVKTNHQFGEAAAVDTIQARITLQQRLIEQQEALLNFRNAGINVSTFLWDSLNNPVELHPNLIPIREAAPLLLTTGQLNELISLANTNHPELLKLRTKIKQLEVDRKLAVEYLKPQLNLTYYLLNQPINTEGFSPITFVDNYKVGLDFSFPLFLRKERARLSQIKLNVTATTYQTTLAERTIENQIRSIFNELVTVQQLQQQQGSMVQSYERLLKAELMNLTEGESDLFKINVQQEKLIGSQLKWLKLVAELEKQKAYLYWAAGTSPAIE